MSALQEIIPEDQHKQIFIDSWSNACFLTKTLSYVWTISNFSFSNSTIQYPIHSSKLILSEPNVCTYQWDLSLYPVGKDDEDKDFLSLFLEYESGDSIFANVELSILSDKNEKFCKSSQHRTFNMSSKTMKFQKFIQREVILNEANNLLHNDNLTIHCKITVSSSYNQSNQNQNKIKFKSIGFNRYQCNLNHVILSHSGALDHNVSNDKIQVADHLEKLLELQILSDVTLIAEGKEFKAHKCILSARSSIFSAMFQHNMDEKQKNIVRFIDISKEVLQELLRFIYCGKVENVKNLAESLMFAADKYEISGLKHLCENVLANDLKMDNYVRILKIADLLNAHFLKEETIKFIVKYFKEIADKIEFQCMVNENKIMASEIFSALSKK